MSCSAGLHCSIPGDKVHPCCHESKGTTVRCCDKCKTVSEDSIAPVRYANGELRLAIDDLAVGGFGMAWGHSRIYSNRLSDTYDYGNGYNWLVQQWPYLIAEEDGTIVVVIETREAFWFDEVAGDYVARYGVDHTLEHDDTNNVFKLTYPDGSVWEFHDFDQVTYPEGVFKQFTTVGGQTVSVKSYDADMITEVERTYSSGGSTTAESLLFDYIDSGDNADRLEYVTLRRKVDSGSWNNIRRVTFTYYGTSEDYGTLGDLKTATLQIHDGSNWVDTDVRYYRYYKDGQSNGFEHGLKYALGPEAYKRLDDAVADPLAATDAQVASYADFYFEYNSDRRVVKEKVAGGSLTYSFAFTDSSNADGFNSWHRKSVETLPDNNQNIVYTNHVGQVMLKEFKSGNDSWIEYQKFNDDGELILQATPAAVSSYDDSQADLNVSLEASDGLIRVFDFYTTTGNGAAEGYLQHEKIKKGNNGTEIKLRTLEYTSHSEGGHTVYPISKETVYRNDDGTGATDTSYSYTWHTGTLQIKKRTTTLPAVPTSQNGPGSSNTREEVFDIYGNLEWEKDERGAMTRYKYDVVTGAMTQMIQDVDTTQVSDEPSGWSTPSGFGLHLVTDYEHDDLGRQTQELGPEHSIDISGTATTIRRAGWTVYQDEDHEAWSGQGYASGQGFGTYTLVNPVSISKQDRAGRVVEEIQAKRASTSGKLSATDTFAQSDYVRWTTHSYTDEGDLEWSRVYHKIPSSGTGSSGTNYDQTDFGYDSMGRQNMHTTPGGTITRTVFDDRGNAQKVYIGTDDTSATESDPTGGGAQGNNMVLGTEHEYDSGNDGGNGNLTKQTQHVDSSTTRVTTIGYDWRDRRTSIDGEEDFYQESTYDNLDRVTRVDQKDTTSTGNLVGRGETKFDDLGRVYQSKQYAVDVSTGTVGNALTDNTWYDEAGNVLKQKPAGSEAFTKMVHDGLGRMTKIYGGFDADETAYTDADNVSGDTLFVQIEVTYDDASNVTLVTHRRRLHNATGTGELTDPSGSQPKARVVYSAMWPDAVGRLLAHANYGTNGGSSLTRPDTVPTRSDTVLVSETFYNDDGEAYKTIDPAGRQDQAQFDDAGRVTKQIENYDDGDPTTGGADNDRTVEFTYTADGQQATIKARQQSASDDQTTTYVYGTSLTDSDVARSDLLRAEIYPDSDDVVDPLGDGADSTYDRSEYKYNRQGEVKERKDQNATVHAVEFDKLGRLLHDRVTSVGAGIDNAVLRLSRTYEVRGLLDKATSYDNAAVGSGSVVNEVQLAYNDFGQLEKDYQAHGSAVDTSTSPKVIYTFADGSSNHVRRTKLTYPNGRDLHIGFNSGDDANLSRVSFLADDSSGSPGTHLAEYTYLGLGMIAKVDYTEPDLRYDLAHGSGNDPYDGLDRFDRIIDLLWRDYGAAADAERVKHGYDRTSNRLWRESPVAAAQAPAVHMDELYTYDGINQLKTFKRGDLSGTKDGIVSGTLAFAQEWSLDPMGNWTNFKQDASGDGTFELDQNRTHNSFNEITQIGGSSSHISHDRAGNTTTAPKSTDWNAHHDYICDAWNRLVTVKDGANKVIDNAYDALSRRTLKKVYTGGSLDYTRYYYYSDQWQVLEERKDSSTTADRQYVWGLRYIDDLIVRDRNADDDDQTGNLGKSVSGLEERLYAMQDPNWNVVALADNNGDVQERYAYDAYGASRVKTATFGDRSSTAYDWETRYSGYRWDGEVALYAVRHRSLIPHSGRWLLRDPIAFAASDTNLYRYVTNAPLSTNDPYGLATCCDPKRKKDYKTDECSRVQRKYVLSNLGDDIRLVKLPWLRVRAGLRGELDYGVERCDWCCYDNAKHVVKTQTCLYARGRIGVHITATLGWMWEPEWGGGDISAYIGARGQGWAYGSLRGDLCDDPCNNNEFGKVLTVCLSFDLRVRFSGGTHLLWTWGGFYSWEAGAQVHAQNIYKGLEVCCTFRKEGFDGCKLTKFGEWSGWKIYIEFCMGACYRWKIYP